MTEITLPDEALTPKPDLTFTLPNGMKVEMWEPDGVILEKATKIGQRVSDQGQPNSTVTTYALIALSSTFDGKRLRFDEIRKFKMRNLKVLMSKFNELNGEMVPLERVREAETNQDDSLESPPSED